MSMNTATVEFMVLYVFLHQPEVRLPGGGGRLHQIWPESIDKVFAYAGSLKGQ